MTKRIVKAEDSPRRSKRLASNDIRTLRDEQHAERPSPNRAAVRKVIWTQEPTGNSSDNCLAHGPFDTSLAATADDKSTAADSPVCEQGHEFATPQGRVANSTADNGIMQSSKVPHDRKNQATQSDISHQEPYSTPTNIKPELALTNDKKPSKSKRKTVEEKELEAMPLAARTKGLKHFVGAHVSMSGGCHNAVNNAVHIGANAFAMFLKSQRRWENPPMKAEHATLFHGLCQEHQYAQNTNVVPHGSYLVNLSSINPEQKQKSVQSFLDDIKRCSDLGIKLYNFHPGNTNGGDRSTACKQIADAINSAHALVPDVTPLLETMASNKPTSNVIGGRFEDLASIIENVKDKSRVGVCIDTCHIFAAGYDIVSEAGFKQVMEDFDRIIGRGYIRAWHINDSKAPMGSGRDLHANLGTGFIGLKGFWNVMNLSCFGPGIGICNMPLVLETPIDESKMGTKAARKEASVKKMVEDKNVWAQEIKLLESLVGMDPLSAVFTSLDRRLSEQGRESRAEMSSAIEKRHAKGRSKE